MSDNEDLLGDDLGDQSLADYNLGNEEEEQLLADDYESGGPQNVPVSIGDGYSEAEEMIPPDYSSHVIEYAPPPAPYEPIVETECVVPNIVVEVPNVPPHSTYAPVEPLHYEAEHAVPPAIPAGPIESPQIVPSELAPPNNEGVRERFVAERPVGAQRMPQVRDIPDSLDKVVIPRGYSRGRTSWRSANFNARFSHPYRRNNMHRANFNQRNSFPPPQQLRPNIPLQIIRQEMRPEIIRPEMRPEIIRPEIRPEIIRPEIRSDMIRQEIRPEIIRPDISQEMIRPGMPQEMREIRPGMPQEIREIRPGMPQEMRDIRPGMPQEMREIRPGMPQEMREIRPGMPQEMREIRPGMPQGMREIRPGMPQEMREIRPGMPQEMREIRPGMPQEMREIRPGMPQEMRDIRPGMPQEMCDIRPGMPQEMREIRPGMPQEMPRPDLPPSLPQMGPEISPERPMLPDMFRPPMERPPFQQFPRFQFHPEERPMFGSVRPNFERPMYPYPRQFNPRYGPPMREIVANSSHMPQVTIRQVPDKLPVKEPEVRMLPVPLPPHIPPVGLTGKKVLINPHFKGNFQPPVEGLPTYIPTRIQKSPPLSPTNKLGPIKDIDDAAERFIAEQRNALARAAGRKFPRRSPQRYIENTTIEIENELAGRPPRRRSNDDDDLLRRQEEFINANRAGLRRRMRSPSPPPAFTPPPRRSPSPSPRRHPRPLHDEQESEYKRRVREQESLRERVLRAKEVRRRKNAVAMHNLMQERERENQDKNLQQLKDKENQETTTKDKEQTDKQPAYKPTIVEETRPDTTRKTPERKSPEKEIKDKVNTEKEVKEKRDRSPVKEKRDRSPVKAKDDEVNSTCEALTPPRAGTPPWLEDDDLELILGDIDGILSDDEDSGRFKDKPDKAVSPKSKPVTDLRSKLPPKHGDTKQQRQKIVFTDEREERKRKDKTPPLRAVVSSTKVDDSDNANRKSVTKKQKAELSTNKSRQRITFGNKEKQPEKERGKQEKTPPFSNRRVILQRKLTKDKPTFPRIETDRSQPNLGIFSRAVRTAIGDTKIPKRDEPQIEFESDSDEEERLLNEEVGNIASVTNLPHGMTDTRLRTLAGNDVQSLVLDKQDRSAKITFKTTAAAETFKKKFNNKMVAASRLTVSLR